MKDRVALQVVQEALSEGRWAEGPVGPVVLPVLCLYCCLYRQSPSRLYNSQRVPPTESHPCTGADKPQPPAGDLLHA